MSDSENLKDSLPGDKFTLYLPNATSTPQHIRLKRETSHDNGLNIRPTDRLKNEKLPPQRLSHPMVSYNNQPNYQHRLPANGYQQPQVPNMYSSNLPQQQQLSSHHPPSHSPFGVYNTGYGFQHSGRLLTSEICDSKDIKRLKMTPEKSPQKSSPSHSPFGVYNTGYGFQSFVPGAAIYHQGLPYEVVHQTPSYHTSMQPQQQDISSPQKTSSDPIRVSDPKTRNKIDVKQLADDDSSSDISR